MQVKETATLRRFQEALRASGKGGAYVRVGFLGDGTREDGGMNNASIAAVHEFGYPEGNIPERPFMGPSFDSHASKYSRLLEVQARAYLEGRANLETALGLLGLQMVTDVRDTIVGGAPLPPPNAPATLARKAAKGRGEVRTLVDTGQMVRSITYVVSTGEKPQGG